MSGNGSQRAKRDLGATGHAPPKSPWDRLPLVGRVMRGADRLRMSLPFGDTVARQEANLLRAEARALRFLAGYLEGRATELERLSRESDDAPRVRRIHVA